MDGEARGRQTKASPGFENIRGLGTMPQVTSLLEGLQRAEARGGCAANYGQP